ncbi:hypothetical protein J7M23_09070 [Candidatus Sumerlaeota bacterium]|nr:hypothetical protein [Candidatus Sumerlaeota bacterium]
MKGAIKLLAIGIVLTVSVSCCYIHYSKDGVTYCNWKKLDISYKETKDGDIEFSLGGNPKPAWQGAVQLFEKGLQMGLELYKLQNPVVPTPKMSPSDSNSNNCNPCK